MYFRGRDSAASAGETPAIRNSALKLSHSLQGLQQSFFMTDDYTPYHMYFRGRDSAASAGETPAIRNSALKLSHPLQGLQQSFFMTDDYTPDHLTGRMDDALPCFVYSANLDQHGRHIQAVIEEIAGIAHFGSAVFVQQVITGQVIPGNILCVEFRKAL